MGGGKKREVQMRTMWGTMMYRKKCVEGYQAGCWSRRDDPVESLCGVMRRWDEREVRLGPYSTLSLLVYLGCRGPFCILICKSCAQITSWATLNALTNTYIGGQHSDISSVGLGSLFGLYMEAT